MTRRINAEGLALIKQWEGCKLTAYKDVAGVLTIGYGSTGPHVKPGMKITQEEAEKLLLKDLDRFERAVDTLVKVPLSDGQFAALVSFAFNVGEAAFAKSTLLRKLNAGDYEAVPSELARWVNAGGRRVQGLVNRRAAEAGLWVRGSFVSSNTVKAHAATPPVIDKETVSWGAGILSTLGASFASPGPLQWALAAIIVVGFGVGLWLFLSKRLAAR